MTNTEGIDGATKLVSLFGAWPTFHDSEVVRVQLARERRELTLELYVFATDRATVTEAGFFRRYNESLITIQFGGVEADLVIENFNQQNVVMEMLIKNSGVNRFEVEVQPSYGLYLKFTCESIRVVNASPWRLSGT